MAGESVTYALRDGETVTVRPLWPRVAFSAGTPGEPAGEGGVFLGTRCIARIPLLWGECTDEGTNSEDPFCARRCLAARSGGADPAGPGYGGRGAVCACASAEPDCRTIAVDGVPIPPPPEHVYLMLYKPRGYITTLSDERGRRTAASLVDWRHARLSGRAAGL